MNGEQKKKLEAKSSIGKTVWFKDKKTGKHIRQGIVEDEVYILVSDYKHLIQRIRCPEGAAWSGNKLGYWDGSHFGYRTGYYTFDKYGRNIVWGQFTQFLTEREYQKLLAKAREKGWPIFP